MFFFPIAEQCQSEGNQIYLYINQNKILNEGYFLRKKKGIRTPIKYPRGTPSKQIIDFNHRQVTKHSIIKNKNFTLCTVVRP
jgi:hypothetical protein